MNDDFRFISLILYSLSDDESKLYVSETITAGFLAGEILLLEILPRLTI